MWCGWASPRLKCCFFCRVWGFEFTLQGLGFKVEGSGLKAQGRGRRVGGD